MSSLRAITRFNSSLFSPVLPDDSQVNPQVYGAELAYWLCTKLARRGCVTSYPHAEDWCWLLEFLPESGSEFALCCCNIDGASHQWQLTLKRYSRKMFGRNKPPYEEAHLLIETIRALLESTPEIQQIEWLYDVNDEV